MLNAAIASLRQGKEPDMAHPLGVTTEINLHTPALLPERLLRRHPPAAGDLQAPRQLRHAGRTRRHAPGTDRPLRPAPEPAQALLDCHRLRILAKPLGVSKIDAGPERTTIQFVKHPPIDAGALILLVQSDGRIRFAGPDRIRIERAAPAMPERIALVKDFLRQAQMSAQHLPPQLHVFVRDWLSANNILLKSRDGHVLIDSGYVAHAPLTLALLRSERGLGGEPLAKLVNTHGHSDHIGGNAVVHARVRLPDRVSRRRRRR